jgi:RecB family exonuclease
VGTAVHRLLELVPLRAIGGGDLREVLASLHRTSGEPTGRDDDVVRWAQAFLASRYGRRLPSAKRVLRELPFVLRLGDDRFALHLRGQIDLLVIDETVDVVDYKTSVPSPAGLEPYRFQLGCYVLAARRLLGQEALPVRAGISYLRSDDAEPRFLDAVGEAALEASLVEQARALVEAQTRRVWPLRELMRCQALGCGYVSRCHR